MWKNVAEGLISAVHSGIQKKKREYNEKEKKGKQKWEARQKKIKLLCMNCTRIKYFSF